MNGHQRSLDRLQINPNYNPEGRRSLTHEEIFIVGWLAFTQKNRNYADLLRDCKLTAAQADRLIEGLIDLELLVRS